VFTVTWYVLVKILMALLILDIFSNNNILQDSSPVRTKVEPDFTHRSMFRQDKNVYIIALTFIINSYNGRTDRLHMRNYFSGVIRMNLIGLQLFKRIEPGRKSDIE
jgi:hypothetical protein